MKSCDFSEKFWFSFKSCNFSEKVWLWERLWYFQRDVTFPIRHNKHLFTLPFVIYKWRIFLSFLTEGTNISGLLLLLLNLVFQVYFTVVEWFADTVVLGTDTPVSKIVLSWEDIYFIHLGDLRGIIFLRRHCAFSGLDFLLVNIIFVFSYRFYFLY